MVGFSERFDESLILLKNMFGWKYLPIYANQNINLKRPRQEDLPASTIRVIEEKHRVEIELYNYLLYLFDRKIKTAERHLMKN